jgi:hypothetical protein
MQICKCLHTHYTAATFSKWNKLFLQSGMLNEMGMQFTHYITLSTLLSYTKTAGLYHQHATSMTVCPISKFKPDKQFS